MCEATRLEVAASTVKSLEQTTTGRPSMRPKPPTLESAGVSASMPGTSEVLNVPTLEERARVEQALHPLPRVERARVPAARQPLGPAHAARLRAPGVEILHPLVPGHGGAL